MTAYLLGGPRNGETIGISFRHPHINVARPRSIEDRLPRILRAWSVRPTAIDPDEAAFEIFRYDYIGRWKGDTYVYGYVE